MKLISQNNFLLIEAILPEEVSVSGIIIPKEAEATDDDVARGKVIAGTEKYPTGTTVLFKKVVPDSIKMKEDEKIKERFILNTSDVMFIETE